jgi:putative ABC transport system substrate-binding protein
MWTARASCWNSAPAGDDDDGNLAFDQLLGESIELVLPAFGEPIFDHYVSPLHIGLVATLARPGGNVTGLSLASEDGTIGKVVEQLKILLPNAHLMGVLWNSANPAGSGNARVRDTEKAIRLLAMTPLRFAIRDSADLEKIFTAMRAQHVDALVTVTDPLTLSNRDTIVGLAAKNQIPAGYEFPEFARAGGLIAYSPQVPMLFERAALYVDKILRGTPPSELPVEQPTKFELVINLKTAKALGLTIPQALLLRANEVIQ